MGRRLYYRDSYGRLRRDRRAERALRSSRSRIPARFFVAGLVALAVIMVLASLIH
jgi:hypothetical protein